MSEAEYDGNQVVVATNEDGRKVKVTRKAFEVTNMAFTGWAIPKPRARKAAEDDEGAE